MEDKALEELIMKHEGSVMEAGRHMPYNCTASKLTIGYGRNIEDCGISDYEAIILLKEDILLCRIDLCKVFGMEMIMYMPTDIYHVLVDMRFNLGARGFRGFKKVIAAAKREDREEMIKEMKDSRWYRSECKGRVEDLITILRRK